MASSFLEAAQLPLLRTLIGLARAADASTREPDEEVFSLLREGLVRLEAPDSPGLLARIRAKKARLIPGCAACASPCGRTADPSEADLISGDPGLFDRKLRVLHDAAAGAAESDGMALLRAVFALGEDWSPEQLDLLIQEL